MPRVIEVADSTRGGNCPVFVPLDFHVAEDKQRGALVLPGVPNFVGGEDHLGPVCGGSFDLNMPYLVTTVAEQVVAFLAVVPCISRALFPAPPWGRPCPARSCCPEDSMIRQEGGQTVTGW